MTHRVALWSCHAILGSFVVDATVEAPPMRVRERGTKWVHEPPEHLGGRKYGT